MLADEAHSYFPDHQNLLQVVRGIRSLTADTGTDLGDSLSWPKSHSDLESPVSVITIGSVNAGKSSLINSLLRSPLAEVSPLPKTSTITAHHSQKPAPELATWPGVSSRFHHQPSSLREFVFIDTPGANRLDDSQKNTIHQLLGTCDIILAVLPSSDPWAPAIWDLISSIPPGRSGRLVIALQHADLRSTEDIRVMTGHLAVLAENRCGIIPPILPIAIPGMPPDDAGWKSGGCSDLWNWIVQTARADPYRRNLLTRWKGICESALNRLDETLDGFDSDLGKKSRFHAQSQSHLDAIRAHFLSQLEHGMEELKHSIQAESRLVANSLRKNLAILRSLIRLFGKDHTASKIEEEFRNRVRSAIKDIGSEDAQSLCQACLDHWHNTMKEASRHGIYLDDSNADTIRKLEAAANRFLHVLEASAHEQLGGIHLRNRLIKDLRRRNRALGAFTACCLLFLTLTGITGAIGIPWLPYLFGATALLFVPGAVLIGQKTKKPIIDRFLRHQEEACAIFAKSLQSGYEAALILVFETYSELLVPLRQEIFSHESRIKPLQRRWQELFLLLKSHN